MLARHRSLGLLASSPLLLVLVLLTPSVHAQVASFDCGKAATPTERAICATPELGRKDVNVAAYYQLLLRLKPATAGMAYREFDDQVRDSQRQWLQQRNSCQGDTRCLEQSYDRRSEALLNTFDSNVGLTFGRRFD